MHPNSIQIHKYNNKIIELNQITGIAALLRFPMPELLEMEETDEEDDDDNDDESDENSQDNDSEEKIDTINENENDADDETEMKRANFVDNMDDDDDLGNMFLSSEMTTNTDGKKDDFTNGNASNSKTNADDEYFDGGSFM